MLTAGKITRGVLSDFTYTSHLGISVVNVKELLFMVACIVDIYKIIIMAECIKKGLQVS